MLIHEKTTEKIIGAAIEVHRSLGPGLLESAYESALVCELGLRELHVERQVPIPMRYKDVRIRAGYRLDLLIDDLVIVEVKSVRKFDEVHAAQLMTYLRITAKPVGLMINFNALRIRDGILRRVYEEPQPR